VIDMKKVLLLFSVIVIAGIMVFTLFHRKAEADRKANTTVDTVQSVSTITLQKQNLQSDFNKVGEIQANNQVTVVSQIQGTVQAVYANVGSYLIAGAPLFKIDDELPKSNLNSAEASYQKAQKDWERAQELHKEQVISDSELESARATMRSAEASYISAKREYKNSYITAPISGVITDRPINLGAYVSTGTTVATLLDKSIFKVKVNVGEQEAFKLKVGDPVTVETDVYPGVSFNGRIKSISDQSDAAHTFPVEVTLPDSEKYPLKSGIFGTVHFQLGSENNALTIPREALVGSVKNPQVYVFANGRVKLRDIVVGSEINTKLVVTKGLNVNEQVVSSGQDNLADNMAVKKVN
jgi:RND family efflux transporter MFP subunit